MKQLKGLALGMSVLLAVSMLGSAFAEEIAPAKVETPEQVEMVEDAPQQTVEYVTVVEATPEPTAEATAEPTVDPTQEPTAELVKAQTGFEAETIAAALRDRGIQARAVDTITSAGMAFSSSRSTCRQP